jgi:hypothetical protein
MAGGCRFGQEKLMMSRHGGAIRIPFGPSELLNSLPLIQREFVFFLFSNDIQGIMIDDLSNENLFTDPVNNKFMIFSFTI